MLIFSVPVKIEKLDPTLTTNAHTKFTLPLIFESLITISPQQELKPVLAKSWSISANGDSVTINIHPNHKFSDGTEVTANDIYQSIFRLCKKDSQESDELSGLANCVESSKNNQLNPSVKVLNKYSIRFTLKSSATTLLYQLSSPAAVITKQSKNSLLGSGPYHVETAANDYTILNNNPFYHGNQVPKNKGIILYYEGGHDINNYLKNNKPDGTLMYRMQVLWGFHSSDYKLIRSNSNITNILVLNNSRFPFNIPLVRKALASEIYNNFDKGCLSGSHRSYGIIPNGIGGSINNMPPIKLPGVKPAELFSAVPRLRHKSITVTLHQLSDLKSDCEAKQITQAAKKYNIDIKFSYHKDYSDLLPLYQNHKLDGFLDLYIFKNREAFKIFEFFSRNGENDANVSDNNIDTLLTDAANMPSSHGRFQQYHKLAQYIQDNNIVIPMFYMDHGNLVNRCIEGISNDFYFNPFSFLPQLYKTTECHQGEIKYDS